jgi:hypothetical protein
MLLKELDDKITDISPVYDSTLLGGHFKVTFGLDNIFQLAFTAFLKNKFEEDAKLKSYVSGRDADSEVNASAIIRDLYNIGCPMDSWVEDYFQNVRARVSQFDALLQLFNHLKTFGDDEGER